jgi:acyl-CoA reductase-like NAD-dependent aldehyde dehydrogenase
VSTQNALLADDEFARNLIGGRWLFPAAPYEFEIRSPLDSTAVAVVPLSSRIDVARAVEAAHSAKSAWSADPAERQRLCTRLVAEMSRLAEPLAALQALETGLAAADSQRSVQALMGFCRRLLAGPPAASGPGVSAHVLSWGLPLAEVVCAVLPHLLAGRTAVVKPSLRAPLSAVAFAHLATRVGMPPGVVNLVQGTGLDVGAALFATPGLATLHVRGGDRTLAAAARATGVPVVALRGGGNVAAARATGVPVIALRGGGNVAAARATGVPVIALRGGDRTLAAAARATGVPVIALRGGGNVAVAGAEADPAKVAEAVVEAIRLHSTGGPLGLTMLAVHDSLVGDVTEAVVARLRDCRPAPLPTEALRRRSVENVASFPEARVLLGGTVPDDAAHRMGWLLPPVVVAALGPPDVPAEPIGPVLTITRWRQPADVTAWLAHPRYSDGIASVWGMDPAAMRDALPQRTIVDSAGPADALRDGRLPLAWTGGVRTTPAMDAGNTGPGGVTPRPESPGRLHPLWVPGWR